ncbi:MAG: RNA polymerase sigma-70 factor [Lacibacter sp.]
MDTSDEIVLIKLLNEGNTEAYLTLYDRYSHLVYNWSLKFVKVPELAEDIVQEVFLKIWQIRERLNPHQSFPAFIYKIARNKAFTALKKVAADEKMSLQLMSHIGNAVEHAETKMLWRQYEEMLAKAVGQLPQQRQKVFKLCRQEGKTYDEVATELGISRNTVKEHMVSAVKNIKEYFYQYGEVTFFFIFLVSSHK